MRRLLFVVLALSVFAGMQRPVHALAESATLGQLLDASLSPDDLDGFYINSDHSGLTASNQSVYDAVLHRDMYVDDLPGVGPAELYVGLLAVRSDVSVNVIRDQVPTAFTDLPNIVQLQNRGSLGVGDIDKSVTWLELNADTGVFDRTYAVTFLRGHIIVIMLFGGQGEIADPELLRAYAQMQDAKLQTPGLLPVSLVTSPAAVRPVLPTAAPVAAPRPSTAPATTSTPSCPNGFIPSPGNGRGPTLCKDGLCSHSAGSGTCSGHGGVAVRIGHSDVLLAA